MKQGRWENNLNTKTRRCSGMNNNELRSLWEQRFAEYEASGKTIKAWCQEQAVKENQFYYWRKKLRMNQVANNQPVQWLSLELEQVRFAPDSIAVHIGQITIEIKKGFDHHLLREIVQVLQTI